MSDIPRPPPPLAAQLLIRMPPAERAALERAAVADGRSTSGLARKIIWDWLKRRGSVDRT